MHTKKKHTKIIFSSVAAVGSGGLRRLPLPAVRLGVGLVCKWHGKQYILDFKGCKNGWFAVVKVTNEETQKESIEVYKIKSVDKDNEEFSGVMYHSTGDQQTDGCLNAPWHPPKGRAPIKEALDNDTVLNYFEKLTKKNILPAKAVTDIKENGIYNPLESGSEDDQNEDGMFEAGEVEESSDDEGEQ